jgi:SAM-dependent methyltransferase
MIYDEFAAVFDSYLSCYDYDEWFEYLMTISELPSAVGMHILDLGCGTGEMLLRFINRKAVCVGVDASSAMIDIALHKFKDYLVQTFLMPMQDYISEDKQFDFIYSMGDSLNYLNPNELDLLFSHIAKLLKPGHKFTFDVLNKVFVEIIGEEEEVLIAEGKVSMNRHIKRDMLYTTVKIEKNGHPAAEESHTQYFISKEQLASLAEKYHFKEMKECEIFTFHAIDDTSEKIQYIFKR